MSLVVKGDSHIHGENVITGSSDPRSEPIPQSINQSMFSIDHERHRYNGHTLHHRTRNYTMDDIGTNEADDGETNINNRSRATPSYDS